MWIFCCGMYRSASTLQFQIAAKLVKDAGIGKQIGWIDWKRFPELHATHADYRGLKVCKVHDCSDAIALEFLENHAKGIYIFRDIRDVYASSMKMMQKSFEQLCHENFLLNCLENYQRWTTLPRVLISRYEDVIDNIPQEIKRIAEHLEISISNKDCEPLATEFTIDQQKERIENFKANLLKQPRVKKDRKLEDYHDSESLLHINHIDSAKKGRWNNDLSTPQITIIENQIREWCLKNHHNPSQFLGMGNKIFNSPIHHSPLLQTHAVEVGDTSSFDRR